MDRKSVTVALATTAAALFATTAAIGTASADEVQVKCYGANACKGHGECKTSMNSCKGKNACKGKSFEMMTEKACIEKVGRA
jgi:hypothetical protein